MSRSAKEWSSPQNALAYLNVADNLPHRSEGESVLIDHLPESTKRILDLGTGDGRLIRLIKANRSRTHSRLVRRPWRTQINCHCGSGSHFDGDPLNDM